MPEAGVLGVFDDPARAAEAVRALRVRGHGDVRAAMPAPFPMLVEALGRPRSKLDRVTVAGALVGTGLGFALCIGTSLAWPLITGGKPIVSIPPFVIIAFELAVLIGAGVNLAAVAVAGRRGRRRRDVPHDPRYTGDRIGIFVVGGDEAGAEETLRAFGAEEIRRVA